MKKNSGFTLVEIMITITIIGILSATVSMSISRYVLERKGEQHVMAFYNQLQQMRAYAQRDNVRYIVVLNPAAAGNNLRFRIAMDVSNDFLNGFGPADPRNRRLFQEQENVARLIRFGGVAKFLPPDDVAGWALNNIDGEWLNMMVPNINMVHDGAGGFVENVAFNGSGLSAIVFENDAIGTISPGILFLQNNNVPNNVCYAIVRPLNENVLRLWKWKTSGADGTWTEL